MYKKSGVKEVELKEVGPRFELRCECLIIVISTPVVSALICTEPINVRILHTCVSYSLLA